MNSRDCRFKRANESSAVGLNTFQQKNWLTESQGGNEFNFAFVVAIEKKLRIKIFEIHRLKQQTEGNNFAR